MGRDSKKGWVSPGLGADWSVSDGSVDLMEFVLLGFEDKHAVRGG